MPMSLRPGDLVEVGGAIHPLPGACDRCGAPAAHFERQGGAIIGHCEPCHGRIAAREAWLASLPAERRRALDHLESEAREALRDWLEARNARIAGWPALPGEIREAARLARRLARRRDRWEARHGAPDSPEAA